jgi:undecaprenyl diphosphate synthase
MIQETHLPQHIGIIMDGNGRWAKKRGNIRTFGHKYGTENVKPAISYCTKKGIQVLTLYTFSTENWKRPQAEVDTLMSLITEYLLKETAEMKANGVVLHFIGDLSRLPQKPLDTIAWAARETAGNTGLKVNIALNYGGRAEICLAAKNIAREVIAGKIIEDDVYHA